MKKYELLYVMVPGLDEAAYEANIEKYQSIVTTMGGTVLTVDKQGIKRLAYPIKFRNDGYYVVMKFEADSKTPAEIERLMRIADDCLRFVITKA